MKKSNEEINYVCQDCGNKNNWEQFQISTWYPGICDVCGENKTVTEFRDFFYGTKIKPINKKGSNKNGKS
jgi:nucleoside-specific outer membrane channel protein Tsx